MTDEAKQEAINSENIDNILKMLSQLAFHNNIDAIALVTMTKTGEITCHGTNPPRLNLVMPTLVKLLDKFVFDGLFNQVLTTKMPEIQMPIKQ